jgi:glycerol-3-phosphate dehydrogenase (NAD(P)+)
MRIAVFGAGAWGTALASATAQRHDVMLWGRDAVLVEAMRTSRFNKPYLPQVKLPDSLRLTSDFEAAVAHASAALALIATPMSALRECLGRLPTATPVLWLCKGVEHPGGALGHEIARELRPGAPSGVLSGPSFALEVARGQPTALVCASNDVELTALAVQAFHSRSMRIYTSNDPIGVEVGGAVKNVLAIATGIADGLGLGMNARAALITRGLAEMTRLGVALGARAETFMGLSGLGDLVLTATGDLSRNRQVGLALAQGRGLADILGHLGHVAEGVTSAPTLLVRARALGVDMPISSAVVAVIEGRMSPAQALEQLMQRSARDEGY